MHIPPPPVLTLASYEMGAAKAALTRAALTAANGVIVDAARLLGLSRHAVKRLMVKYKITYTPSQTPVQTRLQPKARPW